MLPVRLRTNRNKFILLLCAGCLLVACSTSQLNATATPTREPTKMPIDCKSAWEREAVDDPGNLSLALKLGKSRYRLREVIFATLILKNISSVPIWVNNRMVVNRYNEFLQDYGEVYFVLVSRDGRSALFGAQVNADEAEKKYFIELQPNKQLETVSEGIMYYSFGGDGNTGLSEGKYCVWTVYHNQTDPTVNGQVWKGKIKSNMVEFEITK